MRLVAFFFAIIFSTFSVRFGLADTANAQAADVVTLADDGTAYLLTNAQVAAKVSKSSGDLVSLRYKGIQLLTAGSGHPYGYWSHAPDRGAKVIDAVTIDPRSNNGERAEVSVRCDSNGLPVGSGPGGSTICDIEIRYALGRGDSGIYTYCIFTHKPTYPATSIGEARFGVKLDSNVFDWLTIDANRNRLMPTPEDWRRGTPLNMKEARRLTTGRYAGQVEHKYDYSAIQFDIPAFGWSSTTRHVGLWFVNPTIEYLSGGPTKVELTGHLDVNDAGAAPTLLNYWRGSHYGGSVCAIAAGENWTKVVGPFLIYCNASDSPQSMWNDALHQAAVEAAKWPYEWVEGVDYPQKEQRGSAAGRIVLHDPQSPDACMSHLLVGLAAPDEELPAGRGRGAGPRLVEWQLDAKHYQFWTRGDSDGRFEIQNIRPGTYTLHAIADGVLGEFAKTNITIEPGKRLDLGRIEWSPIHFGRQLWQIGVANRSGAEFRHGDHYWQWGLYYDYPREFPDGVTFTIGQSDYRSDWNYAQLPRGDGKPSTWSIRFDLREPPRGTATLRLAFAGASARHVSVTVNDRPAGDTGPLPDTAVIRRDGIRGYWFDRDVRFDASLMKLGTNVLTLTIPPANPMNGVIYDVVRLELKDPD